VECAKAMKVSKTLWIKHWYDVGLEKPDKTLKWKIDDSNYQQVAIISDMHFGNLWQQKTCLSNFMKICEERSIDTLLCAGDISEGTMTYQGHEKDRFLHCAYSYEEYCEDNFPSACKKNFVISGNHDNSLVLYENPSYDFCKELSKIRKDITYHKAGDDNVSKAFEVPGGIKILMYHGSSCSNPALGQKREPRLQQKTAEMMANGAKADIFLYGHCHKKCLTNFMNKYVIGIGCFISDTPYNIKRGSMGDVGGLILKYVAEKGEIRGLETEFIGENDLGGIKKRDF
jgi:predicted phosphodiesterase